MRKIISLFQRNYDGDRLVRDEVVPGAEWVLAGEGVATRKWDGTCCLISEGCIWKRYEVKKGKTAPLGFVATGPVDPVTGKTQGWMTVGDGPDDKWHREALVNDDAEPIDYEDGTYELVGPKIQGNPDRFITHYLMRHGEDVIPDAPRTFIGLRHYLDMHDMEGIVWHRDNGDMVKIKAKDFGLKRGEL